MMVLIRSLCGRWVGGWVVLPTRGPPTEKVKQPLTVVHFISSIII